MARILGIDYGTKRTGIATTDPLQIIVNALDTVATEDIFDYLAKYLAEEQVEKIVVGEPKHKDGNPAQIAHLVVGFVRKLQKLYPEIEVVTYDERFTSVDAKAIIFQSGLKQKKRRDKTLVDKVAATLILQDYLGHRI
ncbi:MAG: Holliday junction resolvase RuvX [Bacteroidetes bacterium]|jgi:putative Holliday junction resolvase|nr:Holliday junction resolvase RuvX [Bacteroidota bacterium]MDF1865738.1 Holliday junction resolvase RuvX [Saprospiraceae bacterium]